MTKISAKATNERREKVWFLMLKGNNNAQSMSKRLNVSHVTIYNDIKFLTKKSQQYVYDMAKGTGIALALSEAWNKFNDPCIPEKQKLGYLRLTKECNESMFNFTANGVSVLALKNIIERANSLGIGLDRSNPLVYSGNVPLSYNNDNDSGIESKSSELSS